MDPARNATCRVCLNEATGDLIPLNYEVEGTNIKEMITTCSGIVIHDTDPFPKNCCERCVEGLFIAYNIVNQCRKSDEKLRGAYCLAKEPEEEIFVEKDSSSNEDQDEEENSTTDEEVDEKDTKAEVCTTCCACRADFGTVEALVEHITNIHEPEKTDDDSKKPFQCEMCFKRYFKKTSLNRHKRMGLWGLGVRVVKNEEPVDQRCCGCRKDFDTLEELKKHSQSEHVDRRVIDDTKPFECDICFKRYANKASLSRHFRERFAERRPRVDRKLGTNQCCGCRLKFSSKEQMFEHSKQIHEPDRNEDLGRVKPHECKVCFSRFSTQEAFNRHKSSIYQEQLYQCKQCDKSFVKRIMLREHERRFHNGVQQDVIGPHQCTRCGKTFMQPSSLRNHEKTHDRSERFECSICEKTFFSKGNLQTHLKLHSNPSSEREAQYECPICRCRFKTPNYLEVHARVHTGEKPYTCKYCSKQFAHASGHKRHLLTHSGLKPFMCRFCGREFSNRPNMLIHEKSHGSERNAKCDICEKEFVHIRYLRKHRKRHFTNETVSEKK